MMKDNAVMRRGWISLFEAGNLGRGLCDCFS